MRAVMFVVVAGLAFPSAVRTADPTPPQHPAQPGVGNGASDKDERPPRKVVATSPLVRDVTITQPYTCQIHARRHIEIRALTPGYLEAIPVKEGQAVKQGDVLFRIVPVLYKAKYEAALAEARVAQIEFENTEKLFEKKAVSQQEVSLYQAKLARARAKAKLAEAELAFTVVKAPFDGLVGRLQTQQGSLVDEKSALTTLSDNSVMWVYFYVPEARYLEYKRREGKSQDPSRLRLPDSRIELKLADGSTFNQTAGNEVTVESTFNNATGNISFRADFPNPDGLLRHGQSGTVLIRRTVKNAVVIPKQAAFETLDGRSVYVVGDGGVVHPREIVVRHELDDIIVIEKGLGVKDKIVLEGGRQLRDGDKVEYVYQKPQAVIGRPKDVRGK